MKLPVNIDRRGRKVRLVVGILVDLGGAGLIVVGALGDRTGLLITGIVLAVLGSFMIFEGANGWCLVRAMGFKTPL